MHLPYIFLSIQYLEVIDNTHIILGFDSNLIPDSCNFNISVISL